MKTNAFDKVGRRRDAKHLPNLAHFCVGHGRIAFACVSTKVDAIDIAFIRRFLSKVLDSYSHDIHHIQRKRWIGPD